MRAKFESDTAASSSTASVNAYPAPLTEKETAVLKKLKSLISPTLERVISELAEGKSRSNTSGNPFFQRGSTHSSTIKAACRDLIKKMDPTGIETLSKIEDVEAFLSEFRTLVDEKSLTDLASQVLRNTNSKATDASIGERAQNFSNLVMTAELRAIRIFAAVDLSAVDLSTCLQQ